MSDLPGRWITSKLADVVAPDAPIIYGILQPGPNLAKGVPYIRPTEIKDDVIDVAGLRRTSAEIAERYRRSTLKADDIVLSIVGTIGKVAIVPSELAGANITQSSCRLRANPDVISRDLLAHYLRSPAALLKFAALSLGTAVPRLNLEDVREIEIPIPPLGEQQQIVAKIEGLSSKSKRARSQLDRVRWLVEKYKQAILAAAFRGELTREWRSNHREVAPSFECIAIERAQAQKKHRQRLYSCDMPELPDGMKPFDVPNNWTWSRAEAICGFITKGTTPKPAMMSSDNEIPFIKVYNLTFDGTLDFTVEPTFVSQSTHEGLLARSKVVPGDVLMNIVGPPLGKVSVVPDERPEWNINQAIAVFRPIASVSSAYLSKWLLTDVLTRWAISRSKATAGQSNLTLEICRDLPVPLCSVGEQQEIVRCVQKAFAWIDRLASETASARKLIDRLDETVLVKAFQGELVPQNPSDEPATIVMERIRAKRQSAAMEPAKRGLSKRKRAS